MVSTETQDLSHKSPEVSRYPKHQQHLPTKLSSLSSLCSLLECSIIYQPISLEGKQTLLNTISNNNKNNLACIQRQYIED